MDSLCQPLAKIGCAEKLDGKLSARGREEPPSPSPSLCVLHDPLFGPRSVDFDQQKPDLLITASIIGSGWVSFPACSLTPSLPF